MNEIESTIVERKPKRNRVLFLMGSSGRTFRIWLRVYLTVVPVVLFFGVAVPRSVVRAQTPLNEGDIIRLARRQSPNALVARATVALAEAQSRNAGRLSNPSLSWTRETVTTVPAGSQDIAIASVPIEVAGPLANRSLVAAQGAWSKAEASMLRTQGVLDALRTYVEIVLAKEKAEILRESLDHLEEAARILERRVSVGSASGYESTRLTLAVELRRSQFHEVRAQVKREKARLTAQLGMPAGALVVAKSFALMSLETGEELTKGAGHTRAVLREAQDAQWWARQAQKRAAWSWLPNFALFGGVKYVTDLGGGYGYVAGVSLDLPVFDHGQALRSKADAQQSLATARSQALRLQIEAEVRSAFATFEMASAELSRFESHTSSQVQQLLRSAQSGYREGERSIVELLDAQNAEFEIRARRLTLRGMAKRAELQLRAAAGAFQ